MWRDQALCYGTNIRVFFPHSYTEDNSRSAKEMCARCNVHAECLQDAIKVPEVYGIRGGKSPYERWLINQGGWTHVPNKND